MRWQRRNEWLQKRQPLLWSTCGSHRPQKVCWPFQVLLTTVRTTLLARFFFFFFLKKRSEDQSLAYTSCSRNVCWMTGETYLWNQPVLHNPHISQHIYDICMIVIYSQSTDSILCDLMKITMICTQERWRIVLMFFWLRKSPELCMPLVKHQSNTETCTIGSGSSTCPRLCRAQQHSVFRCRFFPRPDCLYVVAIWSLWIWCLWLRLFTRLFKISLSHVL